MLSSLMVCLVMVVGAGGKGASYGSVGRRRSPGLVGRLREVACGGPPGWDAFGRCDRESEGGERVI